MKTIENRSNPINYQREEEKRVAEQKNSLAAIKFQVVETYHSQVFAQRSVTTQQMNVSESGITVSFANSNITPWGFAWVRNSQ